VTPGVHATLIEAFEVPPEADAEFIAGWQRAGAAERGTARTLHRALRADAELRFVAVTRFDSPDAWDRDTLEPFPAHASLYDVAREDATPDIAGGVVLINPFEVAPADDERFLAGWDHARETLAGQQGYLGTRLHRSVRAADFRFVNIARWSSPLMFARALKRPEFQAAAAAMPFPSHPALYLVVDGQQSS
jgi:heme-degrading monooxygenase HmoA